MLTQIQHTIESALKRKLPQNKSKSRFSWQSEFLFIQEKSKPTFSIIRPLAHTRSIDPADIRPKGN